MGETDSPNFAAAACDRRMTKKEAKIRRSQTAPVIELTEKERAILVAISRGEKVSVRLAQVVAKTLQEKPAAATHWSRRSMALASGLSDSTVGRIWKAHGLKPHLSRTFKLSSDKHFAEKLDGIAGLYLNPPEHALVFSCDEGSQIEALDRTQPGLPLKKGRAATMTHEYKRNGTTSLFAALNVATGEVIGRCMKKHRHQEWIPFLNLVKKSVPANRQAHVICDNYAPPSTPMGKARGQCLKVPKHSPEKLLSQNSLALLARMGEFVATRRGRAANCRERATVKAQRITHVIKSDRMNQLRVEHRDNMAPRGKRPARFVHPRFSRQLRHEMGRNEVADLAQNAEHECLWAGPFFHPLPSGRFKCPRPPFPPLF